MPKLNKHVVAALSVKLFRCSHEHACWHTHSHICTNIVVINRVFAAQILVGQLPALFCFLLYFIYRIWYRLVFDVNNKCVQ